MSRPLILIPRWFGVDAPWYTLLPWIETPLDWARACAAARETVVLISDNDRFTRDWRSARQQWEQRMSADVAVVRGAGHFNGQRHPEILHSLIDHFGEDGADVNR